MRCNIQESKLISSDTESDSDMLDVFGVCHASFLKDTPNPKFIRRKVRLNTYFQSCECTACGGTKLKQKLGHLIVLDHEWMNGKEDVEQNSFGMRGEFHLNYVQILQENQFTALKKITRVLKLMVYTLYHRQ